MQEVTTTVTTTVTKTVTSKPAKTIYDFFVLDRSGSMSMILESTISGFNEYIAKSKAVAKESGVKSLASVLLFDHDFNTLYDNAPIEEVMPLSRETFVPRGNTALNDAVGRAISSLLATLKGKEASDEVDATITIFTDGQENSSKEYAGIGNKALADLVKKVQDEYKWTVVFVGAGNKDVINGVAATMNILNASHYTANATDSTRMFTDLSSARSAKSMAFSEGVKANVGYFSN
jgi:hypothetical protein